MCSGSGLRLWCLIHQEQVLDARLASCFLRLEAQEMVYVSCDPTTLARDLEVLQRSYRIASLKLVDLFPQTFHMETVVVLERKG